MKGLRVTLKHVALLVGCGVVSELNTGISNSVPSLLIAITDCGRHKKITALTKPILEAGLCKL